MIIKPPSAIDLFDLPLKLGQYRQACKNDFLLPNKSEIKELLQRVKERKTGKIEDSNQLSANVERDKGGNYDLRPVGSINESNSSLRNMDSASRTVDLSLSGRRDSTFEPNIKSNSRNREANMTRKGVNWLYFGIGLLGLASLTIVIALLVSKNSIAGYENLASWKKSNSGKQFQLKPEVQEDSTITNRTSKLDPEKFEKALRAAMNFTPENPKIELTNELRLIEPRIASDAERDIMKVLKKVEEVQGDIIELIEYKKDVSNSFKLGVATADNLLNTVQEIKQKNQSELLKTLWKYVEIRLNDFKAQCSDAYGIVLNGGVIVDSFQDENSEEAKAMDERAQKLIKQFAEKEPLVELVSLYIERVIKNEIPNSTFALLIQNLI